MKFSEEIIQWYLHNKRELPWRKTNDPYRIWLSEIMLQQTRVNQGLPYYKKFIEAFPTVHDLANAEEEHVLKLWQGLGYYSRARNLHYTAKDIVANYNGRFPSTYKELLKLKGVGDYTASAIASICFEKATPVVDGNVYRVLARYFDIETPINSARGIKEFKALAYELIPVKNPATYNQGIMEFGAVQCKPQSPNCSKCPLASSCLALAYNKIQQLPVKLKKQKIKDRWFNYIVTQSSNHKTHLEQRKGKGIWQGLYQFPLIETKKQLENLEKYRTFIEHLTESKTYSIRQFNTHVKVHKLSHQHLHTTFWIIDIAGKTTQGIPIRSIQKYPVPILIGNFIEEFNF